MKNSVKVKIQARVCDAKTRHILKATPWKSNVVYDAALTALATGAAGGFAGFFTACKIGNGTLVNSVGPGAVTFVATGTTLTASQTGWFNTNSVSAGWLMKLGTGTGGVENYIASIVSGGTVANMVSTYAGSTTGPATAWNVTQTTLPGYGCGIGGGFGHTTNYGVGNAYSIAGNVITLTRVFNFAQQGSAYNVTGVGYNSTNDDSGAVNGAVNVSVSVGTTQFLQVQIQVQFAVTPSVSFAFTGGGGFSGSFAGIAGTAALQTWDCTIVNNDGSTGQFQASYAGNFMDGTKAFVGFLTSAPTLNSNISTNAQAATGPYCSAAPGAGWSQVGASVGVAQSAIGFAGTTAGQSCVSICFGGQNFTFGSAWSTGMCNQIFVLNLSTPITLPTGSFSGTMNFQRVFTRTLSN